MHLRSGLAVLQESSIVVIAAVFEAVAFILFLNSSNPNFPTAVMLIYIYIPLARLLCPLPSSLPSSCLPSPFHPLWPRSAIPKPVLSLPSLRPILLISASTRSKSPTWPSTWASSSITCFLMCSSRPPTLYVSFSSFCFNLDSHISF